MLTLAVLIDFKQSPASISANSRDEPVVPAEGDPCDSQRMASKSDGNGFPVLGRIETNDSVLGG